MDRYLMLDIDGVLHPNKFPYDLRFADLVLEVVVELGLKVVISSDWRKNTQFLTLTQKLGRLGLHCLGVTPDFNAKETGPGHEVSIRGLRQSECEYWLSELAMRPFVRVAVDDVRSHFLPTCDWVYISESDVGLSPEVVKDFRSWTIQQINFQEMHHKEKAKLFSLGSNRRTVV